MEAKHPITYFTILEIQERVFGLENISKPKVVFVTGPHALKLGFGQALSWQDPHFKKGETAIGMESKIVRKVNKKDMLGIIDGSQTGGKWMNEIVIYNGTMNMTRMARTQMESGMTHWTKAVHSCKTDDGKIFVGNFFAYLTMLEQEESKNE